MWQKFVGLFKKSTKVKNQANQIFRTNAKLKKLITDLAEQRSKYIGGKFVLNFAEIGIDGKKIKNIIRFEARDFDASGNRIYDMVYNTVSGKTIRAELKNWSKFYPETIRDQFIKDLNKMTELGELKWIFNKTSGISDSKMLKEKVLEALRNDPLKRLENMFDEAGVFSKKMQSIFDVEVDNAKDLLNILDDNSVFEEIFEITK